MAEYLADEERVARMSEHGGQAEFNVRRGDFVVERFPPHLACQQRLGQTLECELAERDELVPATATGQQLDHLSASDRARLGRCFEPLVPTKLILGGNLGWVAKAVGIDDADGRATLPFHADT